MEQNISRIPVKFSIENKGEAKGELIRFLAPITVERLVNKLPIEGRAALTKEGIYFEIPLKIGVEKGVKTIEVGTCTYWPLANSLCIFYGRNQTSSPMSIIGKITENLEIFKNLISGTRIRIEKC